MIEYLIIQLDDTSTSYCHYDNPKKKENLIELNTLKSGILFAMKENLMIQFAFPNYKLPEEYKEIIESIDHSKIISSICEDRLLAEEADVIVCHGWKDLSSVDFKEGRSYVLRTTKTELFDNYLFVKDILENVTRLNIVITDVESFKEKDFEVYKQILEVISVQIEKLYISGKNTQCDLLTDRMMLMAMNNCGAGDTNITLAPNGKFYVCPAFYLHNELDSVGNLASGLDIKNKQLYKLDHAPICRHCDAYHCKRCIWLNQKTTLEVNTPSHEQCAVAHLERNASRELLIKIRNNGIFLTEHRDIKKLNYLDPFDKYNYYQ